MFRSLTQKEFLEKAVAKHGKDRYDYSKATYKDSHTVVVIKCNECDKEFLMRPNSLLSGCGCPHCAHKKRADALRSDKETFIKKARKIHGDKYKYDKVDYVNALGNVIIICPIHGDFLQSPHSHLRGCGCPTCALIKRNQAESVPESVFLEKAIAKHGDKYDYSNLNYKNITSKVSVTCKRCGTTFQQKARHHLKSTNCCPVCRCSAPELKVITALDNRNIDYIYQYKPSFLCPQSLDFYIEGINVGIEVQGIQHYKPISFGGGVDGAVTLKENRKRDRRKKKLCKDNGIKLLYYTAEKVNDRNAFTDVETLMDFIEAMLNKESLQ